MNIVYILGGGVAGLSAAHQLADRGFNVVVYEKNDICGGKARGVAPEELRAEQERPAGRARLQVLSRILLAPLRHDVAHRGRPGHWRDGARQSRDRERDRHRAGWEAAVPHRRHAPSNAGRVDCRASPDRREPVARYPARRDPVLRPPGALLVSWRMRRLAEYSGRAGGITSARRRGPRSIRRCWPAGSASRSSPCARTRPAR